VDSSWIRANCLAPTRSNGFVIDLVADSLVTEFALQIPATFKGDGCRQLRDTDEAVAWTTTTRDPWPVLATRRTLAAKAALTPASAT
jgi:hypothetical protein